jgi:2-hydroxychromene-2-carboxylate isomerase
MRIRITNCLLELVEWDGGTHRASPAVSGPSAVHAAYPDGAPAFATLPPAVSAWQVRPSAPLESVRTAIVRGSYLPDMAEPVFYYDFNSPFAYIAAHRVDDVLPVRPRWQPIAFAFLLIAQGREPWSFDVEGRGPTMEDCKRRAGALGLPLQWPDGWPRESYSLLPLRAAVLAEQAGLLREFSRAAFQQHFSHPEGVRELDGVLAAAATAGLDPEHVRAHIGDADVKAAVKDATDAAIDLGVFGVPTVQVADELFWGDDKLEDAAAALAPHVG